MTSAISRQKGDNRSSAAKKKGRTRTARPDVIQQQSNQLSLITQSEYIRARAGRSRRVSIIRNSATALESSITDAARNEKRTQHHRDPRRRPG